MTLIAFLIILVLLLCGFEADLPVFGLHGFLSIAFPYILLLVVIVFLIGCFFKRKVAIIMVIGMVLSLSKIKKILSLSFPHQKEIKEEKISFTVMSWNIRRFLTPLENNLNKPLKLKYFTDVIKKENPDILCLLDYAEKTHTSSKNISIKKIKKELGMPYHFFHTINKSYTSEHKFGNLILSKYPITKTGKKIFSDYFLTKSGIAYIECFINKQKLRIYTSHFQSYGLNKYDFKQLQKLKYEQKLDNQKTLSLYYKMSKAFSIRGKQVLDAMNIIQRSPVTSILCTDLNDVPNSFCYNTLTKKYKDAFLETGFKGIGRTYLRLIPTLRIDYIFTDPLLTTNTFKIIKKEISDHYPIVATLSLDKEDL